MLLTPLLLSSPAAVVELLRTTGLHRVEDEGAQYALAVAVLPYASDVLSVWVYAATLLPALQHGAA